jgi:hypothetical protein
MKKPPDETENDRNDADQREVVPVSSAGEKAPPIFPRRDRIQSAKRQYGH